MPLVTDKRRRKVSITLDPEVVRQVEEYQRDAGLPSFSAALEEMLWRRAMEEKEKEREQQG